MCGSTDQGSAGATCRLLMFLQPAPRAQRTSWQRGSEELLYRQTGREWDRWTVRQVESETGEHSPVCERVQVAAVAAGQPQRPVGEDVRTLRDRQVEQTAPCWPQQSLHPRLQTAPDAPVVILSRLIGSSASWLQVVENHSLSLRAPLGQGDQELHTEHNITFLNTILQERDELGLKDELIGGQRSRWPDKTCFGQQHVYIHPSCFCDATLKMMMMMMKMMQALVPRATLWRFPAGGVSKPPGAWQRTANQCTLPPHTATSARPNMGRHRKARLSASRCPPPVACRHDNGRGWSLWRRGCLWKKHKVSNNQRERKTTDNKRNRFTWTRCVCPGKYQPPHVSAAPTLLLFIIIVLLLLFFFSAVVTTVSVAPRSSTSFVPDPGNAEEEETRNTPLWLFASTNQSPTRLMRSPWPLTSEIGLVHPWDLRPIYLKRIIP